MDKLDSAITTERLAIESLKQELETKKVRLEALLEAARLRPSVAQTSSIPVTNIDATLEARRSITRRIGREPGSINGAWQKFLGSRVADGNALLPKAEFIKLAADHSGLAEASARQRIRSFIEAGWINENVGMVCVSEAAIERFRLRHQKSSAPPVLGGAANGSGASTPDFGG